MIRAASGGAGAAAPVPRCSGRTWASLASFFAAAALLAACGDGEKVATTPASTARKATDAAPSSAATVPVTKDGSEDPDRASKAGAGERAESGEAGSRGKTEASPRPEAGGASEGDISGAAERAAGAVSGVGAQPPKLTGGAKQAAKEAGSVAQGSPPPSTGAAAEAAEPTP